MTSPPTLLMLIIYKKKVTQKSVAVQCDARNPKWNLSRLLVPFPVQALQLEIQGEQLIETYPSL